MRFVMVRRGLVGLFVLAFCLLHGWPTEAAARSKSITTKLQVVQPQGAAVFQRWLADTWVKRQMSLADLGLNQGFVLGFDRTHRDIYWPVPKELSPRGAQVQWKSTYQRADAGRTTLVVSVDGIPAVARGMAVEQGEALLNVPIAEVPVPTGFVRMGVDWQTILTGLDNASTCTDKRSMGNFIRVDASTTMSYEFDAARVNTVSQAWSALPMRPVIWVAGEGLPATSFELGLRVALILSQSGKQAVFQAFPSVGQVVDLDGLFVPEPLREIEAFATLSGGGRKKLVNAAQLGAWFVLTQVGHQHADLVVMDDVLRQQAQVALTALSDAVLQQMPSAHLAYKKWREQKLALWNAPVSNGVVEVHTSHGGFTLVVPAPAGAQSLRLFASPWQSLGEGVGVRLQSEGVPAAPTDAAFLHTLPGAAAGPDVGPMGVWESSFALDAPALQGKLPDALVIDVKAAQTARGVTPVATVFLNGVLLGSRRITSGDKNERLDVTVPSYALGLNNLIRVVFMRPPEGENCLDNLPQYPFSVLPTSHVLLGEPGQESDFKTVASRFSKGGKVLFPLAWLKSPMQQLPKLVRLSAAAGVSPLASEFLPVQGDQLPALGSPFLAIDVGVPLKSPQALVKNGQLIIRDEQDKQVLDLIGLTATGVASVERFEGHLGVVFQTVRDDQARYDQPFRWDQGDFGVLRQGGQFTAFDVLGNIDRRRLAVAQDPRLTRYWGWWLVVGLVMVFVGLLYAANHFRNRKNA